jgi:hypothetical protein
MRGSDRELEAYVLKVANLLERFGGALRLPADDTDLEVFEDDAGGLSFELGADLPRELGSPRSEIVIRETFDSVGPGAYERSGYEYELIDRARGYRRAFHLHDPEWFERRFLVVVHEHCERPIGSQRCSHYEGAPIRDAYAGIYALIDTWIADPPDCSRLRCLE